MASARAAPTMAAAPVPVLAHRLEFEPANAMAIRKAKLQRWMDKVATFSI
jgi:hypothetical protein